MGLLDAILGGMMRGQGSAPSGGLGAQGSNPLLQIALQLLQQNGGLQGVLGKFQQAGYGDQAQRASQGSPDALPVLGGGNREIEITPWELAQARHIDQSAVFAQTIEAALRERVPMSPRALQKAPFRVLVGANMPAVLVEMGFITNPGEEKQLNTASFQSAIVQSLVASAVSFREYLEGRRATSPQPHLPAPVGAPRPTVPKEP